MADLNAAVIRQLSEHKGQQLRALMNGDDPSPATRQMEELAGQFISQTERFVKEHAKQLNDLQLPADAVVDLLNASLQGFIAQKHGEVSWQVPDESMSRFPESVRLFFRPPSAATLGDFALRGRPPDSLTQ